MPNKNDEQRLKNAILGWIQLYPNKGFAWTIYNGGVYDVKLKMFRKHTGFQRKGIPDINGIWCGRPLYIEVKTQTGPVRPEQKLFIEQASSHGAIALIARDLSVLELLTVIAADSGYQRKAPKAELKLQVQK